jgi:signal transduction histidine kinase
MASRSRVAHSLKLEDGGNHPVRPVADRLQYVFTVAQLLAREPDGATLATELAALLPPMVGAELALVATVVDSEITTVAGGADLDPAISAVLRAIMTVAATRRERLVSTDAFTMLPGTFSTPASVGWGSLAVMPALHHAGHAVAVLLVASPHEGAFTDADLMLLGTIAEQAVVGLDRAQLLGRLSEWSNGMEALLAFSGSVHQHRAPELLVNEMVEHAARFLKADAGRGGLAIARPSGELVMEATAYWQHGTWTRAARSWRRKQGIPGIVLDHEFAYLAPDYPNDPAADAELVAEGTIRHALCVPLRDAMHSVVGFLELHRGVERAAFTWNDAAFLEALADTTAMAIENARLVNALEAKNEEIRQLFARHAERLEEERQHIARDLHDETGQALVGVKLALQVLSRVVPATDPTLAAPLDELRLQVNQATSRFRQLARRLRPPSLDQHGLASAIGQLAHDAEQRSGVQVDVVFEGVDDRRWPLHETAVFRIVQEALTNVCVHAQASTCAIRVSNTGRSLAVRIVDDGRGFRPDERTPGLGLRGISERVHMLGGSLQVTSAPGEGTRLLIDLPLA